jgi:hypothetical protein
MHRLWPHDPPFPPHFQLACGSRHAAGTIPVQPCPAARTAIRNTDPYLLEWISLSPRRRRMAMSTTPKLHERTRAAVCEAICTNEPENRATAGCSELRERTRATSAWPGTAEMPLDPTPASDGFPTMQNCTNEPEKAAELPTDAPITPNEPENRATAEHSKCTNEPENPAEPAADAGNVRTNPRIPRRLKSGLARTNPSALHSTSRLEESRPNLPPRELFDSFR